VFVKIIRKILQFAAVAGQAGEFRERKAADVAALDVLHHALGLRVLHDGFSGLSGKVIDLLDLPATALAYPMKF
jgi:hypothetical protein